MAEISEATKDKILQSAKNEFLEKGFSGASLRIIAANAGLTTGAMYRNFKDKDALFCALVDDIIQVINEFVKLAGREAHEESNNALSEEHTREGNAMMLKFIDYMYENFDAFTLLFTKAAGSTHENFIDEISDSYTNHFKETIAWAKEKYNIKKEIDDMTIHVIATTVITAFAEIIFHKMEKSQAINFINNIKDFFQFGLMHMMGLPFYC